MTYEYLNFLAHSLFYAIEIFTQPTHLMNQL